MEGYSLQFRQLEFVGALAAITNTPAHTIESRLSFENAMSMEDNNNDDSNRSEEHTKRMLPKTKLDAFNEATQYIVLNNTVNDKEHADTLQSSFHSTRPNVVITNDILCQAVQRCSLVHALYRVIAFVADGSYNDLNKAAMAAKEPPFAKNESWRLRVRHFQQQIRYGARARSMQRERTALQALDPFLATLGGKVRLDNPDWSIYIFDSLRSTNDKLLTKRIARGPRVSVIAPNTRICVTNTPLCPLAAFTMVNVASIRSNHAVLDPYAGSGAILLAAAMVAPSSRTVGIEIAHNGVVNRNDIQKDFTTRQLTPPRGLLQGDCTDPMMRVMARIMASSTGKEEPFDCIVTDPPYGIRESHYQLSDKNDTLDENSVLEPIEQLLNCIIQDRQAGTPLLKKGGKLVVFVPVTFEQTINGCLPDQDLLDRAGVVLESKQEQPLNEKLSRWMVAFRCIHV